VADARRQVRDDTSALHTARSRGGPEYLGCLLAGSPPGRNAPHPCESHPGQCGLIRNLVHQLFDALRAPSAEDLPQIGSSAITPWCALRECCGRP
jgi:hypothetical protein